MKSLIEEEKGLPALEEIAGLAVGTILGLLPARWQIKLTDYKTACVMSTSSRSLNIAFSLYACASLAGADQMSYSMALAGAAVAADTAIRELASQALYYVDAPKGDPCAPIGEPVLTLIDMYVEDRKSVV